MQLFRKFYDLFGWGDAAQGAMNLAGDVYTANMQEKINQENIAWQNQSLDINEANTLKNWNLQNEYNTPAAQMQRFKDAGLNPNLVYSQGNPGNAGAIATPQRGTPDLKAPDYRHIGDDVGNALAAFQNYQFKKAQIDNTDANTTAAKANAALTDSNRQLNDARQRNIDADTSLKLLSNASGTFDLGVKSDLRDTTVESAKENLRQISNNINLANDANDRAWRGLSLQIRASDLNALSNDMSLRQGLQNILNMRMQNAKTSVEMQNLRQVGQNLKQSNELNQLDIDLKSKGLNWSDPAYIRQVQRFIDASQSHGWLGGKSNPVGQ